MGQHNSHQPYPFGFKEPTYPFGLMKTTASQEPNPPQSLKEKRTKKATYNEEGTTAIVKQKHKPSKTVEASCEKPTNTYLELKLT